MTSTTQDVLPGVIGDAAAQARLASDRAASDLKQKTVHGAVISGAAQGAGFVLRTGSTIIMARLLFPADFGLFGMVGAFTGFLLLFRDLGLSMASVTQASVTNAQISTLFWVNVVVGVILAALCAGVAPLLVIFYGEPRLLLVTIALGTGFIFNGAAAQHRAILQRNMQFRALAAIDTSALLVGILASIGMAAAGYGYWALVVMTVSPQVAAAAGAWFASGWIPGKPSRHSGVRSMLQYGGTVTFNNVIVYFAYNVDKILLGRFWGADALGIYGRAYQLINLPIDNLNATISQVALPALSRVQGDPARLRRYFLQGYALFFAVVVPIMMGCGLFSDDIVRVFLGAKWHEASAIFRLLAPTMLVFALVNPLAWLMLATGRTMRSLKIALVIAPAVVLGYLVGLPAGPSGVAAGFSGAMLLLAVPIVVWATHGTPVTTMDIIRATTPPLVSIAVAAAAVLAMGGYTRQIEQVFLRLVTESGVLFGVYAGLMLFAMDQKAHYLRILRETGLWSRGRTAATT